jgi:hypothetical protein
MSGSASSSNGLEAARSPDPTGSSRGDDQAAASASLVLHAFVEQQSGDGIRGLEHCVVTGWKIVHLPRGIGEESRAESSEWCSVLPSGAVDELAPRDLSTRAREPDRLQE